MWQFKVILAMIIGLHFFPARAEESMPTAIHHAIASQETWLNTARRILSEDLAGRILLLDFWTFCCINCIHVIPDLKFLEKEFGDDLTVIGVHSAKFKNERDTENIRSAILRYGIAHPVVNDFDFKIWQSFGVRAWPTLVLINPDGKIERVYSGEGNREAVAADVERLRREYAGKFLRSPLPLAPEKDKAPPTVLHFPGKLETGELNGQQVLFVSDSGHHRILAVTLDGKIVQEIGTGTAGRKDGGFAEAQFRTPQGLAYDANSKLLYVADTENHTLRVADFSNQTVRTVAGTGGQGYERDAHNAPALKTPLASPWDIAFYPSQDCLAIAMAGTHQLWQYDIKNATVTVIAGNGRESIDDGAYPHNSLSQPSGLAAHGGKLYFVDSETSSLRVLENGRITTLIGTGLFDFGYKEGVKGEGLLQHPLGVLADDSGVTIADSYNHSIRRYDPKSKRLENFAGHGARGSQDGALPQAEFNEPNDAIRIGDALYVADTNNHHLRRIDLKKSMVETLEVMPAAAATPAEFSESLPNLEKSPPASVAAGQELKVTISLQPGWKINGEAPSALALFAMEKQPKLIQAYALKTVKTRKLTLPPLESGKAYRLQGTLYYCEEKAGSQCLIKSIDLPIAPEKGATGSVMLAIQ